MTAKVVNKNDFRNLIEVFFINLVHFLLTIMEIKEAQNIIDQWIKQYGVRYFSELNNLAILTEEVGELARIIVRKYGEQSAKKEIPEEALGDEMADVLFVLMCLANQTGVDLTDALKKNLEKKTKRDHERHLNNPKLKEGS